MIKHILNVLVGILLSSTIYSQAVVLERSAELMNEMYTIEGTAFLEELDNGVLQLRLSEDFTTPAGPDVRIYLNNSISPSGAIEVVNLSDINHFNGALTVEVPAGVNIDDYEYIVFFCFAFQQLWASGEWSDSAPPGGGFDCEDNEVTLSTGNATIDICPSDGGSDILTFTNTLDLPATTHYAYLLTDENEILEQVVTGDSFNFEGTSMNEQRVYGIHYDGTLQPAIGNDRSATSASGCFTHSSNLEYIEITKNACPMFDCFMSNTFTSNNSSSVDICPSDGNPDIIPLLNSINENPGEHYAYLITDINQIVQDVIYTASFNFEGSDENEQRVYGVHFDGVLNPILGSSRLLTTATGCFTHSNNNNFLKITKDACPPEFQCLETSISSDNSESNIDICPSDNQDDIISLENNLSIESGLHFAYLITDDNEIVKAYTQTDSYNFEGSSDQDDRVYGIHFDGDLNVIIGENRTQTTAIGCYEHSSSVDFLTITKNACPPPFECLASSVATTDWVSAIDICPTDDQADIIELRNSLLLNDPDFYVYLITDQNEIVSAYTNDSEYNFEGGSEEAQRVYGVHYEGVLNVMLGQHREMTTATGCFEHSSSDLFLTITKNACPPSYECSSSFIATTDWVSEVEICPTDGEADNIELRNNIMVPVGEHFAFLLTDANQILQEIVFENNYNFEGSDLIEQRVYGINYDGELDVKIGEDRLETTASGCYIHSNDLFYLTISKTACIEDFECVESLTASAAWATNIDICANDGIADEILIQNNINTEAGEHYAFLLTDTSEILLEVFFDSIYNFEGLEEDHYRVYGVSYSGQLEPAIGEVRQNTSASDCYIHSGGNLFITVNTKAECIVSTKETNVNDLLNLYPNPSSGLIHIEYKEDIEITNAIIYNSYGAKVMDVIDINRIEIENPGVYILQILTENEKFSKRFVVTR